MSESLKTGERNPYLALRDAKIARNHARLQELGLTSTGRSSLRQRVQSDPAVVSVSAGKRKLDDTGADAEPTRRSLRTKKLMVEYDIQPPSKPIPIEQLIQQKAVSEPPTVHRMPNVFVKNSAREMELNVERLLFGSSNNNNNNDIAGVLGMQLPATGKAFVIEESARRAVDMDFTTPISFNKYCGAQEWGNVIYLWINFNSPSSEVVNTFSSDGRQVNWFGGSKMHDGTKLIQRLQHMGIQAAQQQGQDSDRAVILWCRYYNPVSKGFDPYVCFGRLSVSFLFLFR
jgi:hypothetical protein